MKKKWSKVIFVLGIFLMQIVLLSVLFSIKNINEFIIRFITFPISELISRFTNHFSIPVGELFYSILLIIIFIILSKNLINLIYNRVKLPNTILQLLVFINIMYFIYSFSWGIMYKKETLTFNKKEIKIDVSKLKIIYCNDLEKAIEARKYISKNDSLTPVKFVSTLKDYNNDFFLLQNKVENLKWIKNYRLLKYSHYKLSAISPIQNHLGILGYYNPFTAESNLNNLNTDLKKSSTLFHEYAHQMGFASESEANFLAYYLGSFSKNPEVRYSIYYKSVFSLLAAIYQSDPYFVKAELESMPIQITMDRKAEINHYEKYNGKTSSIFSELNNQFLKANNEEGTISYGKYILLIYYLNK